MDSNIKNPEDGTEDPIPSSRMESTDPGITKPTKDIKNDNLPSKMTDDVIATTSTTPPPIPDVISLISLPSSVVPSAISIPTTSSGKSSKSVEMNQYLDKLKEMVPFARDSPKMSKVQLIHCAIDYITDLQESLEARVKRKLGQKSSQGNRAPLADLSTSRRGNNLNSELDSAAMSNSLTPTSSNQAIAAYNEMFVHGLAALEAPSNLEVPSNSLQTTASLEDRVSNPTKDTKGIPSHLHNSTEVESLNETSRNKEEKSDKRSESIVTKRNEDGSCEKLPKKRVRCDDSSIQ